MKEIEIHSWLFVYKKWDELQRMPIPDKGFEDSFREYIYRKIKPDVMSNKSDMGFGLSYSSLSSVPHEVDVICSKGHKKLVFELKHYNESRITKEHIFTFLGKVMDFYLKNAESLSYYQQIIMYFVTINKNIDDSIRKLCLAYGIRLIEPSFKTLGTLSHFVGDLYQKIPENEPLKSEVENLIENISILRDTSDYTFSDIFMYKDGKIEIGEALIKIDINDVLNKIKKFNELFEEVLEKWKSKKS